MSLCIDPGHTYALEDGTTLHFRRKPGGNGATTCELLEVLIHRIETLDKLRPCNENIETLLALHAAHGSQIARAERIQKEKGT